MEKKNLIPSGFVFTAIFIFSANIIFSQQQLSVRLLSQGRKIVPIYYQYDPIWHSDIKLPEIVVENKSGSEISVTSCEIIGISRGHEIIGITVGEERIAYNIQKTGKILNRLLSDPKDPWKAYNLKKIFGNISDKKGKFNEKKELRPGEKVCISFSDMMNLHYSGPEKIDEMSIRVSARIAEKDIFANMPVVLTPYTCKGDYIFPVPGSATVCSTPVNGHRILPSSEFAVDIIDYRRLDNGALSLSDPPQSKKAVDYFAFNREVLAIGNGVVVETGNGWPNEWMDNPLLYSEDRIYDLTLELLDKGVKFQNAYIGNYIILDHQNGEFSAYVHLAQNTITVKPGHKVIQGQVIGKIGNTGNSTDPHLHFQLMDSPDYTAANGLPVMFKNLPAPQLSVWDMNAMNTLFHSDYLFVNTNKK